MPLGEWVSNLSSFNDRHTPANVDLNAVKPLGLLWDTSDDSLKVKIPIQIVTYLSNLGNTCTFTKRKVVSLLSTIFDRLGMLNPVTIKGKLFVKKLWELKTAWDGDLRIDLKKEFDDLLSQFKTTEAIRVPRSCFNGGKFSLHVFVDASQVAYGACAYVVSSKQMSHLLISKSRVAPSPPLTIPRQELLALTIGTRLAVHLLESFGDKISDCTVWSDSKVALSWLFYEKSKEVFVINRVKEIKDLKFNHNIRLFYVCTEENPADLVTREQEAVVYRESVNVNEILAEPSLRVPDDDVITFNCSEFSTLKQALRIVGRLIRFGRRIFPEKFQESNNLLVLIRIMQRQAFPTLYYALNNGLQENSSVPSELRNLIRQLGLYVDESGVIRCQGRIQNADLSESAKHPVYVASRQPLWPLTVSHYHILNLHCNTNTLVIILQQQFWAGKNSPIREDFESMSSVQFAAKHGLPRFLISDNAPNFIAAKLSTIVAKAENIISDRPLTYVNEDNADDALTPAKLLYGSNFTVAPPLNKLVDLPYHENVDLRENYAKLCRTIRKFEKLWLHNYLFSLRERHKNVELSNICPLNVGDLVLIVNENCKRYKYPLGIIEQLHAGPDNVIRTAEIRTASGNFTRPLNQVIPLECNVIETSSTDNKQDEEGEAESVDVGDDLESVAKDEKTDVPLLQMTCDRPPMRRAAVKVEEHRKQLIQKGAL
ncbi:uncharacterized protein [Palaemon carinicauda]|uniref:uncharacterized protein n=1 Tax=Palaemon carinicauda TaxID=392227 RepID=UPI0035B583C9